jgi:RNA polymerase sigma-70 factor, ECF subfamily
MHDVRLDIRFTIAEVRVSGGRRPVHLCGPRTLCQGESVATGHDFEAIWREAGPAIWRSVYAYAGGRREVADDALAEAFARAIVRGDSIREPVPYLYRVAYRIAAEELKRMQRGVQMEDRPVSDPEGPAEIVVALRHLTPAQRAAVYLHYRADLPVREIASIMQTSAAAVRVHLMRGRRRLADVLGDEMEVRP